MKTCQLISCWRKQKCHLEEQGMEDLCPAVKEIVEDAKEQTERAWREQTHPSQVVPLTRFRGTARTIVDSFSIDVALQHMRNYEEARRKKFLKARAFEKDWEVRIIDPGPMPKPWLPLSENNNFYDADTNIEDRSVVVVGADPVDASKKLLKAQRILTRQEVEHLRDLRERERLQHIQDARDLKIEKMLESMEV